MKKTILTLGLALLGVWGHSQSFTNPILSGFYPDPAMCKAGSDYYIINSSFAYFPGLPIFHSKDLVNWELQGYALSRPEQLQLEGAATSEGLYAPDIKYHNGTFYVVCTNVTGVGNFIVTAKDPKGPWSNPKKLPEINGIDPSLFFDGDSSYIVYNSIPPDNKQLYEGHRTIRMAPISLETLTIIGPNRIIVNGGTDISKKPVWIEGPHIFRKDNWYYLICAQNGTSYNHTEVVFRSRSLAEPFVPYEKNPILTQMFLDRNRPNPVTTTGHADFVKDDKNNWWAIFLGCRPYNPEDDYNTGRETFMAPVKWTNDWPVIDLGSDAVKYEYPIDAKRIKKYQNLNANYIFQDDFSKNILNPRYAFLRTPNTQWYSLTNKKGFLEINLRPETCEGRQNPSFIGFRQAHLKGNATTELKFAAKASNEKAGLIIFQNETHYYFISKSIKDGKPTVELWKGSMQKRLRRDEKAEPATLLASVYLKSEDLLKLKIEANNDVYNFYYQEKGQNWNTLKKDVDGKILSTRLAGGFVGCLYAMYATSNGESSSNKAYFDSFKNVNDDDVYKK